MGEFIYTEQAVETLDDAGSVIANKNIEIEQLRQRVAELEEVRDAALAEVALLKPNPLCDTGCMLSCKMEADYYEKQITALKSALREAMKEMLRCQYYEGQLDKAVAVIAAALGEET